MSSLPRTFGMFFFSLSLVFVVLILKDSTSTAKHIEQIEDITILTKLPGLALSTSFLEKRISFYEDNTNNFYLNMEPNRFTDFVYAQ